jgi:DNA adenine methylase
MAGIVTSPIAYPGAKTRVTGEILDILPNGIEDWREPFFGGGSVSLAFIQSKKAKNCKRFVVGDLYKEVYYFWRACQEHPKELVTLVETWWNTYAPHYATLKKMSGSESGYNEMYELVRETESRALWKWVQSVDVETLSEVERGARFYLSSTMSFSGVADSGGMSRDRFMDFNFNKLNNIYNVSEVLQRIEIYNQSFEETMKDVTKDKSFIFLDPPYISQEVGHLYGKNGSTHNGFPHEALASLCKSLECKWLMTLDDCVMTRKLYAGCKFAKLYIPYTMTSLVGRENRLNGEELFISNFYEDNPDEFNSEDLL